MATKLPPMKTVAAWDAIDAWVDARDATAERAAQAARDVARSRVSLTPAQWRTLAFIQSKGGVRVSALHMGSVKRWGECRTSVVRALEDLGLVMVRGGHEPAFVVTAAGVMALSIG